MAISSLVTIQALANLVNNAPYRALDSLVADCTVSESHLDQMEITEHPVELGSAISDNTYRRPSEITLIYGFSLSPTGIVNQATRAFQGIANAAGSNRLNVIYQYLLNLQVNRTLFDVFTARRYYPNMALKSVSLTTDQDTENAMIVKAVCKQLTIATTSVTPLLPATSQAIPAVTATPAAQGSVSLASGASYTPGVSHP